jgi:hypothetical protein
VTALGFTSKMLPVQRDLFVEICFHDGLVAFSKTDLERVVSVEH